MSVVDHQALHNVRFARRNCLVIYLYYWYAGSQAACSSSREWLSSAICVAGEVKKNSMMAAPFSPHLSHLTCASLCFVSFAVRIGSRLGNAFSFCILIRFIRPPSLKQFPFFQWFSLLNCLCLWLGYFTWNLVVADGRGTISICWFQIYYGRVAFWFEVTLCYISRTFVFSHSIDCRATKLFNRHVVPLFS
jgi:hypothetical protein